MLLSRPEWILFPYLLLLWCRARKPDKIHFKWKKSSTLELGYAPVKERKACWRGSELLVIGVHRLRLGDHMAGILEEIQTVEWWSRLFATKVQCTDSNTTNNGISRQLVRNAASPCVSTCMLTGCPGGHMYTIKWELLDQTDVKAPERLFFHQSKTDV